MTDVKSFRGGGAMSFPGRCEQVIGGYRCLELDGHSTVHVINVEGETAEEEQRCHLLSWGRQCSLEKDHAGACVVYGLLKIALPEPAPLYPPSGEFELPEEGVSYSLKIGEEP